MAAKLPYLASPGLIPKILMKIVEARRPDRFTQDFLGTVLGFSSGTAQVIIPMLKRLGFLNSDGTPTQLYDRFRNESTRGWAMAQGLRMAYKELFDRNEYAYKLTRAKLESLITEITGAEKDNKVAKLITSSFMNLCQLADFEATGESSVRQVSQESTAMQLPAERAPSVEHSQTAQPRHGVPAGEVGLNLSYTINLNLPETTNPEVFNAIFRSLKENLLK